MKKIFTSIAYASFATAIIAGGIGNTKKLLKQKPVAERKASIVNVEKSLGAFTTSSQNNNLLSAPVVPFYTENFSSGSTTALPTGWSVSNMNSGGTPTSADWKWRIGGGQGSYPVAALAASANTTPANGAMIYDSDFLCGSSGISAVAMLTSPAIVCTGHPTVKLSFYESYTKFQDTTFVEVSTNNNTWTRFDVSVNQALAANASVINPTKVGIDISSVAANAATVYIRFVYQGGPTAGCDYGWIVDDVSVSELPDNDLSLVKEFYDVANGNTPITQVDTIFFGGRVSNTGALVQSNTWLNARVKSAAGVTLHNTNSDTISLAFATDSLLGCADGFTPTAKGTYRIVYNTKNDTVTDGSPNDNRDSTQFIVSDSTFLATATGYSGSYFLFNSATSAQFNWGYIFDLPNADTLTSVAFATREATSATESFAFELHKFENAAWSSLGIVNRTVAANEITTSLANIKDIKTAFVIDNAYKILEPGVYAVTVSAVSMGATSTILGSTVFPNNSAPAIYDPSDSNGPFFTTSVSPYIKVNFGKPNPFLGLSKITKSSINVFPNPTSGLLNIKFENHNNSIARITNVNGQLIYSENISNKTYTSVDMSLFAKGIYTLQIISEKGLSTQKVVKQ